MPKPKVKVGKICFIGRIREGRLASLIGRQALSYEKERDVTGVLARWGVTSPYLAASRDEVHGG